MYLFEKKKNQTCLINYRLFVRCVFFCFFYLENVNKSTLNKQFEGRKRGRYKITRQSHDVLVLTLASDSPHLGELGAGRRGGVSGEWDKGLAGERTGGRMVGSGGGLVGIEGGGGGAVSGRGGADS